MTSQARSAQTPREPAAFCTFCGKSNHEVDVMIAGPVRVWICDECVELCCEIVVKRRGCPTVDQPDGRDPADAPELPS